MTGKTVEEAVEAACAALELLRDDVSVEVLEMPQKRLFGSTPAKVRVYVSDDAFSVKDLLKSQDDQPSGGKAPSEGSVSSETEKENRQEPKKQIENERVQEPKQFHEESKPEVKPVEKKPEIEIPVDQLPGPAKAAYDYLKDVADRMQTQNLTFKAVEIEGGVKFAVDGEDAAILIGRRGETMDALQYLCLLVSNRAEGEYCKISLDVADYRMKRERTLEALAERVANKVLKNRRSQTLEPMNPYERRVVHSTVQNIAGVKSESVGEDPHRRVVILLEGDSPRPYRGRDDRGGNGRGGKPRYGGGNRDRDRGDRPRRDSAPQYNKPAEKPAESKPQDPELEKNLYGKIEL